MTNWINSASLKKPSFVPDNIPMWVKWKRGRPTKQARIDRNLYNEWYREWRAANPTSLELVLQNPVTDKRIMYQHRETEFINDTENN